MLIGLVIIILSGSGYRYWQNRQLEKDLQIISASTSSSSLSSSFTDPSPEDPSPIFAQREPQKGSSRVINVNTADRSQLETLPGIGPVKAQAIIDYRQRYGPFRSVDELIKVKGIGPKTLEKIRPFVTVTSSDQEKASGGKTTKETPSGKESVSPPPLKKEISLTSPAFKEGEYIPRRYTCQGEDLSPPLHWSGKGDIASWALICEDPDAPRGTFIHWVLYNLPDTTRHLPEGLPAQPQLSWGALQGKNDFGSIGYRGPCPPPGKPHRYFFILYALKHKPSLKPGLTKDELLNALKPHIIGTDSTMGLFRR